MYMYEKDRDRGGRKREGKRGLGLVRIILIVCLLVLRVLMEKLDK